ncbi:MAG TPA: ribosome small subunit-dependent GTPase A [Casimicrobiaceae bacterium]|nr:ribosome small subunit-dependent GTPase A [Casimicrobiaceae bacterium]
MSARGEAPDAAHRHTAAGRVSGLVVAAHRRHYVVDIDGDGTIECVLKGRRTTLACGDRVDVERSMASSAIVDVLPRRNLFYRSDAFREKLIAANVSQVLGVVAPDIPVDEHLLNRWIIAAETERCRFALVVNKADLAGSDAFAARFDPYARLGYPVLRVSATQDVSPLRPWIASQHSLAIGQSGMGKSTLINALLPDARARIGEISQALRSGRHTTSSTALYRLPGNDGWIVDSPGMTVFGLAHCAPSAIEHAFVELRDLAGQCRFRDCGHDTEPGCAVQAGVRAGRIAAQRVELLHALLREARAAHDPAR